MADDRHDLGSRTFGMADQQAFAQLSGDWNPMHMDPVAAQATRFGAPVLHGVHGVLWALEAFCGLETANLSAIRAKFMKPAFVGQPVRLTAELGPGAPKLRISSETGQTLASISVQLGAHGGEPVALAADGATVWSDVLSPDNRREDEMGGVFGVIEVGARNYEPHFPKLTKRIGADRVSALGRLSTIVGMITPGLHSIFNSLTIDLVETKSSRLTYRAGGLDDRFKLLPIQVSGAGVAGHIDAFARDRPAAT